MERNTRFINWSGGLAESDVLGLKGSYVNGQGLNIHSNPGLLTVNQALKKASGSIVTDFCKFRVVGSDGNVYWFGDTGKIYQSSSTGTGWVLKYTDANGAIVGVAEFNGFMYWATATNLHRKPMPGAADWSDTVHNWNTLTSSAYHPMVAHQGYLILGNNLTIATVDTGSVFTAAGTTAVTLDTLPANFPIVSITKFDIDVLVGTSTLNGDNTALIARWDTTSPSYLKISQIQENSINTFLYFEDVLYAICGGTGYLYFYNGEILKKFKRIPGNYDNQLGFTYQDSWCVFRGLALFGASITPGNNGDPFTAGEGVYSLGRYDKNYPYALNMEYVISQNVSTGISIGAIASVANTLIVAWKNGSTYGVDVIDWTNKFTGAFVKTVAVSGERMAGKNWTEYAVTYKNLPGSSNLNIRYFPNYGTIASFSPTPKQSSTFQNFYAQQNLEYAVMQFQVDFTVSGNNAPTVDGIFCNWDDYETNY
ncbi:MAG: hypothetical protein NVSMB66_6150 [Candidatus Doudnabacteria bacterium]